MKFKGSRIITCGRELREAAENHAKELGRAAAVHFMAERGIPAELAALALYGLSAGRRVCPTLEGVNWDLLNDRAPKARDGGTA